MAGSEYKASVRYAGDDYFIGTTPGGYPQLMDSKGDRHAAPTPLEMLLVSVAACTAFDVQSILEKKRLENSVTVVYFSKCSVPEFMRYYPFSCTWNEGRIFGYEWNQHLSMTCYICGIDWSR